MHKSFAVDDLSNVGQISWILKQLTQSRCTWWISPTLNNLC